MCVQHRGVEVICGVFSTVGDIMNTVGDIMNTVGDIMNTVGDIISTMGVFSTMEVSSVLGGVQYHGENLLLFENHMVLNTLHGTHDIPHMYHDIPHGTKITKDGIPHTTEHPTALMISSTVLNTPTVLMISAHAS